MKRIVSMILAVLMVFISGITAFADNSSLIYVDKVTLVSDEPILIPVRIHNNSGIMGFKITVEYSSEELEILLVSKGGITANGNFNTNLGKKESAVDIVWNNTSQITGDGILFIISAKTKLENLTYTELKSSYSQPDTFNEAYEDVVLDCGSFTLAADPSQANTPEVSEISNVYDNDSDVPDSTQILNAIDSALEKYGYENLSEVENESQFVTDVNDYLNTFAGTNAPKAGKLSEIIQIYETALAEHFGDEIKNTLSEKQLIDALKTSLEAVKADSVSAVSANDRKAFIKEFYNNVKLYSDDIPNITEKISDEKAIEAIASLTNESTEKNPVPSGNKNTTVFIAVIIVAVIAIVTIAMIVCLKRKKQTQLADK